MKYFKIIFLIAGLFSFVDGNSQQFYFIPSRTIKPYELFGHRDYEVYTGKQKKNNYSMLMDSFNMSRQITLAEYKEYLEVIKKDSTQSFYNSQFPDTTIVSKENYSKYITGEKYNSFPAVGIIWEAAMNFCKWKTLKENKNGEIKYIYRLPKISEWLDAYDYLENNKYENDLDKNYSDWTMNLYYEGAFTFGKDSSFTYDVFYLPRPGDKPRDKRMRIIGDSYLYQREKPVQHSGSFFGNNGYRQVAFRIVREYIAQKNKLASRVNKYWNLSGVD